MKMMIDLFGTPISQPTFPKLTMVGCLLDVVYPIQMIWKDEDGTPIVEEWCDCLDFIDRHYWYKTTVSELSAFINNELDHRDLIKGCVDGKMMLCDSDREGVVAMTEITVDQLPEDYLPNPNCYFRTGEPWDLEAIVKEFNITVA